MSNDISSEDQIKQVATISANNDKEIGDFCAYLCTEAASWIHGQSINLNGGTMMEH